jgi:hypothetical protein
MNQSALATQPGTVSLWKTPQIVLEEAQTAAKALMQVIALKNKPVIFNGEQYIEREDWGTVAMFYKCHARTVAGSIKYIQFGDAYGFEAACECVNADGTVLGYAESMCLSDEDNWGDVPVYEDELDDKGKKIWIAFDNPKPGKAKGYFKKKEIGRKPKPLFQLRSMAQTRAEAKCLKSVFGPVVVLAGFKPSVAEEMTGSEQPSPQEQKQANKASEPPPVGRKSQKEGKDVPIQTIAGCITERQIKLLFYIQNQAQIPEAAAKAVIKTIAGVEHRNEIKPDKFDEILKALDPEEKFHKPLQKDQPPPEQG